MRAHGALAATGVVAIALGALGCAKASIRLESARSEATLEPRPVTSVYRYSDSNTMDIIVSDMPLEQLLAALAGERATGNVTHMHLFFMTEPGRTPLDATASNTTIRHVVFAGEQIGVYGGGGLLRPSSGDGSSRLSASVRGASMRLLEATPGFVDRLGASDLSGWIIARRNDDAASEAVDRLAALYLRAERAPS